MMSKKEYSLPSPSIELHMGTPATANGSVNTESAAISIGGNDDVLKPVENSLRVRCAEKTESLDSLGGANPDEDTPLTVMVRRRVKASARNCCSVRTLKRKLPIITWLPKYRLRELQSDFIAGLTVGLTVIPQGLAYAVVAGLPPQYGLYSAFMGCFVYMFFGTSKDITLGPTAIMSLLVGTYCKPAVGGLEGVQMAVTMAMVLTFFCGVVQLAMGIFNLGFLVNYISHSVINSFTSAAAITIGWGQVKNILGLKNVSSDFLQSVYDTCAKIPQTKVYDLVMGIVCIIVLFLLRKLRDIKWDKDNPDRVVPMYVAVVRKVIWLLSTSSNAIVVITAAGCAAGLMEQKINVISITGNITAGLPHFGPPAFSYGNFTTDKVFSQINVGLAIVPLLGLVESIAIGKAFARVNNYKIDPTQELVAIGVANIVSSFCQSYPVTGSFSRTAVNSQSGVRTPAGGLFTGSLILLAMWLLLPYCYYLPKSALAAVIIMAVIQMVDYRIVVTLWKTNKLDLFVHLVTFICSLCIGIEYGILIGIGLSLLLLMYPMARPKIKVTAERNFVVLQPDQGLVFPAIEYLEGKVFRYGLAEEKPKDVILDMLHISATDYTTLHGLKAIFVSAKAKGIRLLVCQTNPRVRKEIAAEKIDGLKLFATLAEAIEDVIAAAQGGENEPFVAVL